MSAVWARARRTGDAKGRRGGQRHCLVATLAFGMGVAVVVAGLPAPPAHGQEGERGCPASQAAHPFADAVGSHHEPAVGCLAARGVTSGVTRTSYGPGRRVTRGQLATFVARSIERAGGELPEPRSQGFTDVESSVHADRIRQLAEAGVVAGVDGDHYRPQGAVRRDQMASFLTGAYEHVIGEPLPAGPDRFDDVDGNPHEDAINRAAEAELARGVTSTTYAPATAVRRDRMASFLARLLDRLVADEPRTSAAPENVILLVGDGMGYNMVDAASAFEHGTTRHQVRVNPGAGHHERLGGPSAEAYQEFPQTFAASTAPATGSYDPRTAWSDFHNVLANPTDSAAAGTALATGRRTTNGTIGLGSQGERLGTVAERAQEAGKAVGAITSTPLSHATPAAFLAHHHTRADYHTLASQMLDSGANVLMGAGHPRYDNDGHERPPSYDYLSEGDFRAVEAGETPYRFVDHPDEFAALADESLSVTDPPEPLAELLDGNPPEHVLGLARAGSTLQQQRSGPTDAPPFAVQPNEAVPSLATMTRAGLNVLDHASDEGFFAMVEGGGIDWAGHDNQTGRLVEEQMAFDDAVDAVVEWVESSSSWDETLVVVTADHETGYLAGPGSDPTWQPLDVRGEGQLPGVSWHTAGHTNQLVPVFAKGAAADRLWEHTRGRDALRGPYLHLTGVARLILGAWEGG